MKKQKKIVNKKLSSGYSYKRPAVFLDRDGTINYDNGYTHRFSEFKFRPYVLSGLKYLSRLKYLIFIVTNQAGIAKGKFKLMDLLKLNSQLKTYLKKRNIIIHDIEFCPYHPKATVKIYRKKTSYRKPGNSMITKLQKKWNVNMKKSFMIGDRKSDKSAAQKSNLHFEYVEKNFYKQVKKIINSY